MYQEEQAPLYGETNKLYNVYENISVDKFIYTIAIALKILLPFSNYFKPNIRVLSRQVDNMTWNCVENH